MNYTPKLVHLPGTELMPEVVLHRTLNKLEHMKSVVIIIGWNDGSYAVDYSQMKVSELCLSATILNSTATQEAFK